MRSLTDRAVDISRPSSSRIYLSILPRGGQVAASRVGNYREVLEDSASGLSTNQKSVSIACVNHGVRACDAMASTNTIKSEG